MGKTENQITVENAAQFYCKTILHGLHYAFETEALLVELPDFQNDIKKYWDLLTKEMQMSVHKADRVLIERIDDVLQVWADDGFYYMRANDFYPYSYTDWFWWLDRIRKGIYPWQYIPDHIKDLCEQYYDTEIVKRGFTTEELAEIDVNLYKEVVEELEDYLYERIHTLDLPLYRKKAENALETLNNKIFDNLVQEADRVILINIVEVLNSWKHGDIEKCRGKDKDKVEDNMWFWWLDKIKDGTFPWEHIPDHLKDVCKKYYEGKVE